MSQRMKSPRGPAPRIPVKTSKPGPFQQLANDLATYRRQKTKTPMVIIRKRP